MNISQKGDMLVVYHCSNPGRYKSMAQSFDPKVILSHFETQALKYDIAMTHRIDYVHEGSIHFLHRLPPRTFEFMCSNGSGLASR